MKIIDKYVNVLMIKLLINTLYLNNNNLKTTIRLITRVLYIKKLSLLFIKNYVIIMFTFKHIIKSAYRKI